jgi:putative sterol carrier protein
MNMSQQIGTTLTRLQRFDSEKAGDLKATIQLILIGHEGGKFVLHINEGQIKVGRGQAHSPDLALTMASEDFLAIMRGEADPMKMIITGQIGVEGDRLLAMRLKSILLDD